MPAKWQKWMPFHIDSFYSSPWVQAMHPAAQAGYLKLLAAEWQTDDCTLPADEEDLAILSGLGRWDLWKEHAKTILRHFSKLEDGRLQNGVCLREWMEAKRIFEARQSGRKGKTQTSVKGQSSKKAHTRTVTDTETSTEKPKATPLSEKPDEPRPAEYANSWNRLRGTLPKVTEFTESRRKKVQTRQRQGISLEAFEKAVATCAQIPFLTGDNDRGWNASFDWLIDNDKNLASVMEGKYESRKSEGATVPDIPTGELIRQRREEARMDRGHAGSGLATAQT